MNHLKSSTLAEKQKEGDTVTSLSNLKQKTDCPLEISIGHKIL